jgi:DNA-binding NarL/FixJ family response regulator
MDANHPREGAAKTLDGGGARAHFSCDPSNPAPRAGREDARVDQSVFELLKDFRASVVSLRESVDALRHAVSGIATSRREMAMTRADLRPTSLRTQRLDALRLLATLSARQRDVLQRILGGQPNKVMAFELGVSEKTIETHRARLMKKLEARTLAKMVETALLAGLQPTRRDEARRAS